MGIGVNRCDVNYGGGGYVKPSMSREENRQVIRERIDELLEKLENGETEVSYQIGGRGFTEKEWDRLLNEFDSAEEKMKKLVEEEKEKLLEAEEKRRIEEREQREKM